MENEKQVKPITNILRHFRIENAHTGEFYEFDSLYAMRDIADSMTGNFKMSSYHGSWQYYGLTRKGIAYCYWTDNYHKIWLTEIYPLN